MGGKQIGQSAHDEHRHSDHVLHTIAQPDSPAASALAASWYRSAVTFGLDPSRSGEDVRLDGAALKHLRAEHAALLAVADPILDHLFAHVGLTGCCVLLTDKQGVVLESRAHVGDQRPFEQAGLAAGADWSEARKGTNGIGTCLTEKRPVTIHRDQHFISRNIHISCMDAPVFDARGQLVAALDISTARADHTEAVGLMVQALVQDAARQIERDLFLSQYAHARIMMTPQENPNRTGPALLALDGDDLVIGATRAARQKYQLTETHLAAPRPLADIIGLGSRPDFDDAERKILVQAMARAGGNISRAAKALGIGRATFYRRMEKVGLDPQRPQAMSHN